MNYLLWLLLGIVAAIFFVLLARRRGPRREPAFLALGLLVAAIIYIGFALVGGDVAWIAIEVGGLLGYAIFVWLAWHYSTLWLTAGWAAHPLWDLALHGFGPGHSVAPEWYVYACLSFDLIVAGYILASMGRWRTLSPTAIP